LADNHRVEEPGVREPHDHSAMPYILVWGALVFLTGVTYFTGKAHLGAAALPLALSIATAKAVLVALFFMHLWEDRGANRLVLATSVLFVLLLVGLTLSDVATRFELDTPRGAPFGTRTDFAQGSDAAGPSGSPAGSPAHDGPHPGVVAPSEGGLPHGERESQDPSRP
jgi:cytochrome c oxidase subunit 4